ncbi:MAG: HEAT repeat domain-containing protein [Chloroflexi bacterium]|nr:HEAT repeat domain-containing protein [Chloroflexota bacterium]
MTQQTGHEDEAEPLDGLRRVIGAITSGVVELEPEDLHAVSRLAAGSENVVHQQLSELDSAERFALLDRLREVGAEFGGYDFTVFFGAMLTDEDASVRTMAVSGLALCETPGATAALLATVRSDEEETGVRREAVNALGEVAMRVELGWAASEDAGEVVGALRTIVEDDREDEEVRATALSGIGVISESWVTGLIEDAFESDAASLHLGAVQAMGRNADVYWLPVLEGSLVAEDDDERIAAVQAIGEIGSEDGAPMLLELFDDPSASEELIRAAVAALGEVGSEEAVEALERLRTHPDPGVRATAQAALEEATWLDDLDDPSSSQDPFRWAHE